MLLDVKSYLEERGQASLTDLSIRFATSPDAMRGMLGHWIGKGRVQRIDCGLSCGKSCAGCGVVAPEIYAWLRPAPKGAAAQPATPGSDRQSQASAT